MLGLMIVVKTSFAIQIDEARQSFREIRKRTGCNQANRRDKAARKDILGNQVSACCSTIRKSADQTCLCVSQGRLQAGPAAMVKRHSAGGGRWSGGAGAESPQTGPSRNPRSRGHHFVPGELYRSEPLKPETRKVFEDAVTGPLRGQQHGNSEEHQNYSRAVREAFDQFKSRNGIVRSEDMTPDQAKKFVDEVRDSNAPNPILFATNSAQN